ncbi:Single-stranded DNA-binding protein [Oligella urethralis]|uniref:single-stranded DNA-binding protein n=1 Tax=Oligella urethralis TaxID=90245 RepID=UPI002958ACC0|nr:single-stranded DNA-binding protein [Oligella urethralis]WOS36544.1 Single-stranded DNA-binding protein [Oligella urethralis]
MSVNKVILVGRLGADPEARATPTGLQVCNLSIATNHVSYDRDGKKNESTEWHRVVFFGRQAEVCEQYLRKGSQVYVEGRLRTNKYTDRDGIERYATEVVGERMQMLGSVGPGSESISVDNVWEPKRDTGDGGFGNNTRDLPPGPGGQNPPPVKQTPAQPSRKPDSFDELEDDLPF